MLVLAHDFPPAIGVGALRPAKFAQYLPELGWHPVVVTRTASREARAGSKLLALLPANVEIHRVRSFGHTSRARAVRSKLSDPASVSGGTKSGVLNVVRDAAFVPDTAVTWWPMALPVALRACRRGARAIYATAPPFSTLVLGKILHDLTGLPLVSDFRDPWTHSFAEYRARESSRRLRREARMEAGVVRASAAVVVTAPRFLEEMRERYPDVPPDRFHLITNGHDAGDFARATAVDFDRPAIVMTGKWAPQYEPDRVLVHLAAALGRSPSLGDRLRLHVVGEVDPRYVAMARELGVERMVVFHGPRDAVDTLGYQLGADALLVLQPRDAERRIAAKIFEYLFAGPPILAIVPPHGATADLVRRAHAGAVIDPNDGDAVAAALAAVGDTRSSAADREALRCARRADPLVRSFERHALAQSLAAVLDGVAGSRD